MSIERTMHNYGRMAMGSLGVAAVAAGIAAVTIIAVPGIKLTIAGAAVAAFVFHATAKILDDNVEVAKQYPMLNMAVSAAIGQQATYAMGYPVGFVASLITSLAAAYLHMEIGKHY